MTARTKRYPSCYRRVVTFLGGLRTTLIVAMLAASFTQWLTGLPVLAGIVAWVVVLAVVGLRFWL